MPVCEFDYDAHLPAINGGMFVRAGQKLPVPQNALAYLKRQSCDGKPVMRVIEAGKQVWPESVTVLPSCPSAGGEPDQVAAPSAPAGEPRRSRRS